MAPLPGGHKLPYMAKMVINGRLVHSFPFPIKISKIVRCYGDDHGDGEDNLITTSPIVTAGPHCGPSLTCHTTLIAPDKIFECEHEKIFVCKCNQIFFW